jgi:16S rRNA (cytidine1402-2'-O)-methyltransferase
MISVSGLVEGPFKFEGILPSRARLRDERLDRLGRMPHPFVLFEAPHRIAETLPAIAARCGADRWLAIGRELTKKFEEVHRCRAGDSIDWLAADPNRRRGEYVLVVAPAGELPGADSREERTDGSDPAALAAPISAGLPGETGEVVGAIDARRLLAALLEELPPSRAVRVATRATGLPHRQLYQLALELAKNA